MARAIADPYAILGVSPTVSEAELRAAYRRAVQREHPDHNGGSPESARRFEAIQAAYAEIRELRRAVRRAPGGSRPTGTRPGGPPPAGDSSLDTRLADMERELAAAREARERAQQAAREAARDAARQAAVDSEREASSAWGSESGEPRPSDEELGYIKTEDSFGKIFADAAAALSEQLSEVRRRRGVP